MSDGFTKGFSLAGWRMGYLVMPQNMLWMDEFFERIMANVYGGVSLPQQMAVDKAIRELLVEMDSGKGPTLDYFEHECRIFKAVGEYAHGRFKEAGIQVHAPAGTFYLFLNLEPFRNGLENLGISTSSEMTERLREDLRIIALPGERFGQDPKIEGMEKERFTLRFSFIDFGREVLAASRAIALDQSLTLEFVRRHCPQIVLGCDRLCDWVRALQ